MSVDESPACECKHPKHAHDHPADHQRPSGKYRRRCMAFDSYGCPCECPGYDPVPDEDDIGDDDCVTRGELDELDDICRGRLPINHNRRITASPDVSGDADASWHSTSEAAHADDLMASWRARSLRDYPDADVRPVDLDGEQMAL